MIPKEIRMSIRSMVPRVAAAALAIALGGCAGGWRNGPPPGYEESSSVAATTSGASAPRAAATVNASDSARFTFKGEASSVALAGEFNAWSPTADPMIRRADGSWTIAKKLPPGRYPYKFAINGGATWKEDPNAAEFEGDPYGGKNSIVVVGGAAGGAAAAPVAPVTPAATGTSAGTGKGPVTTEQGTVFVFRGDARSVALAGDFNAWSPSADPLVKQADGTWKLVKKLQPGRYEYKFAMDGGTTWKEDPDAAEFKTDPYGGKNSIVVVGPAGAAAVTTGSAPASSTPAAGTPVTGKPRAPFQDAAGVTFTYAGPASRAHLAGDFNEWSTTTGAMKRQSDGTWTLTLKLAPGTYQYRFLVDGASWKTDEANPQFRDDPLGGRNSVVTVK